MREATYSDYVERVTDAIAFIVPRLSQRIQIAHIASEVSMSPFRFQRVFNLVAGENIMAFTRRLRLERAALLASTTNIPIGVLALEAGYQDVSSLNRAFKPHFGSSLDQYRRLASPIVKLPTPGAYHYGDPLASFIPILKEGSTLRHQLAGQSNSTVLCSPIDGPTHKKAECIHQLLQAELGTPVRILVPPMAHHGDLWLANPTQGNQEIHVSEGHELVVTQDLPFWSVGDLWARIGAELLPRIGRPRRPGSLQQEITRLDQNTVRTSIHIPLA